MADFSLGSALGGFIKGKSIVPAFKFIGTFTDKIDGLPIFYIEPWHVKSVSFEQHSFKQESQFHGPGIPLTFPVLDKSEQSYLLHVVLEEDRESNVLRFIEYCKTKIINQDGSYKGLKSMKSLSFDLEIMTTPSKIIHFDEIYFLTATTNEFNYASDEARYYDITFGYDNYKFIK